MASKKGGEDQGAGAAARDEGRAGGGSIRARSCQWRRRQAQRKRLDDRVVAALPAPAKGNRIYFDTPNARGGDWVCRVWRAGSPPPVTALSSSIIGSAKAAAGG